MVILQLTVEFAYILCVFRLRRHCKSSWQVLITWLSLVFLRKWVSILFIGFPWKFFISTPAFSCFLAVDKSLQYSLSDAREAFVLSTIDMLSAYSGTLPSSQLMGTLMCPYNLRLLPLFVLALLKFVSCWSLS